MDGAVENYVWAIAPTKVLIQLGVIIHGLKAPRPNSTSEKACLVQLHLGFAFANEKREQNFKIWR